MRLRAGLRDCLGHGMLPVKDIKEAADAVLGMFDVVLHVLQE